MTSAPSALRLEPRIQHYAWGDPAFIPDLLGRPRDGRPWAEAWYGAHSSAPSFVHTSEGRKALDDQLAIEGARLLGSEVTKTFGTLPYLIKLLAAARPLSIQVHPDAAQARAGFDREQAAGIAIDAPHRNYKDPQHKPELIVALTPFHALCGFRGIEDMEEQLARVPELCDLLPMTLRDHEDLDVLIEAWFALPDAVVRPALDRLLRRLSEQSPDPSTPEHWAREAQAALGPQAPADRGLLFLFLLELKTLRPGQALFLDAGVPHAYLQGAGIEVMAASDNVLRAGLTPKYVDVPELLRIMRTDQPAPAIVEADGFGRYGTSASEFELQRLLPDAGGGPSFETAGPEVLLALEQGGEATVQLDDRRLTLARGEVLLLRPGTRVDVQNSMLWRCRVPQPKC